MGVKSKTYEGTIGEVILAVPELAFRKIVSVKREGKGFDIITTGSPTDRQVVYRPSAGVFAFLNEFTGSILVGPTQDYLINEKIFIIWDE